RALERQGLYDADDAFFYDRVTFPSGESTQVKVRTISGLLPLLPAAPLSAQVVRAAERLGKRFARLRDAWTETGGALGAARVWMPLNYLAIRQFMIYHHFFGNQFTLEYPTGSGRELTFGQIAQDLADRIISIWLPGPDGRRPLFGGTTRLQTDPAWKDNLVFN